MKLSVFVREFSKRESGIVAYECENENEKLKRHFHFFFHSSFHLFQTNIILLKSGMEINQVQYNY